MGSKAGDKTRKSRWAAKSEGLGHHDQRFQLLGHVKDLKRDGQKKTCALEDHSSRSVEKGLGRGEKHTWGKTALGIEYELSEGRNCACFITSLSSTFRHL